MAMITTTKEKAPGAPAEKTGDKGIEKSEGGARDKDADDKKKFGGFGRRKQCRFCADQEYLLDYKDSQMMQSFVSEHGRIVPRRISGTCALHQRSMTQAVKRARNLALVGFVSSGA